MPILTEYVFGTPNDSVLMGLFVFAAIAQQVAIAATHQSEAAHHQSDRATTKIADFPGTFGTGLRSNGPIAIVRQLAHMDENAAGCQLQERFQVNGCANRKQLGSALLGALHMSQEARSVLLVCCRLHCGRCSAPTRISN